jgi:hypothetical protein
MVDRVLAVLVAVLYLELVQQAVRVLLVKVMMAVVRVCIRLVVVAVVLQPLVVIVQPRKMVAQAVRVVRLIQLGVLQLVQVKM